MRSIPTAPGGANASFALIARNYMRTFGVTREDVRQDRGRPTRQCVRNPHALMKTPLTIEQYLAARPISDPIHLFDCVMPCAGAEAFLVMREETAASLRLPVARLLSTIERHNAFADDPMQVRGGWAMDVGELYAMAGVKPDDLDIVQTYDDYPVITMMQFEDLGFCKKGRGPSSCASMISPSTVTFRTTRRADSSRPGRPAPPAPISVSSRGFGRFWGLQAPPRLGMQASLWPPGSV